MTVALMWAGSFMLFILVYILVLAPQKKSKKQIEKQLADTKQTYNSVLKAAQEETKVQLNEQIAQLRNRFKDYAIDFEDSANLTFDISQIANEKKVSSFSIKTKEKLAELTNCDYISENHMNISFTSDFKQFATFLNTLERYRPVVFIDKFEIIRSKQGNSGHEVNMSLAVFVKKQQDI